MELLLSSKLDIPKEVHVGLRRARWINDLTATRDIAEAYSAVPPGRSWVIFTPDCDTEPGGLYLIWLQEADGIGWCYQEEAPEGTNRASHTMVNGHPEWRSKRGSYLFRLTPISRPYSASNVLNGVARPERWPNVWISDSDEPLPQHLDLDLQREMEVNTVYLTFDADLDTNIYLPPPWGIFGAKVIRRIVRDYELYAHDGHEWVHLLSEVGNHHRRRIHPFTTMMISKLRLEVRATNGDPSARVHEIRVYNQEA